MVNTLIEQAFELAFESAEIARDRWSQYILLDENALKTLGIEQVEGSYLVYINKRSVISYEGYEYQGETYYTVEQIPSSLYNVEYNRNQYAIRYFDSDGSKLITNNPTSYTPDTDTFTLENPEKDDNTFLGWTGTGLTEITSTVTLEKGSTGDREYFAIWKNDGSKPRIIITADTGDKTKEDKIIYTIKFTEPVNEFNIDDIIVENGTKGEFNKVSDTEYTIEITGGSSGEQKITIPEGVVTDKAGNKNEETTKIITKDDTKPKVAEITTDIPQDRNVTGKTDVTYTFKFDEPVNGFTESDIEVVNGTKGEFKKISDTEYTIVVSGGTEGEQKVTIKESSVYDNAGNRSCRQSHYQHLSRTRMRF